MGGRMQECMPTRTRSASLTSRERILNQIHGEYVDRIPMIGGWVNGAENLARIAGISIEEYLNDPHAGVVKANKALGVDAVVPPVVSMDIDTIRTGSLQESTFADVLPEALRDRADSLPGSEAEILATFDAAAEAQRYREHYRNLLGWLDGLVLIPTHWEAVADFSLYFQFGYEAFLAAIALYPESVEKIWWHSGVVARERNKIIIRMYQEFDLVPMLFCGHDICTNAGPMCSPRFLTEHYWPHAKYSVEPFIEAGIRLVHHCDGNVMPLIDDMIAAGFSGFQGFQYECGVDPHELRARRDVIGRDPLFMAGLSVSRTLPLGSVEDVKAEVDYCLDYTDGGRGLFLFTSNVVGVEVPPENVIAAYRHMAEYDARQCGAVGARVDCGAGGQGN